MALIARLSCKDTSNLQHCESPTQDSTVLFSSIFNPSEASQKQAALPIAHFGNSRHSLGLRDVDMHRGKSLAWSRTGHLT